MRRVSKHLKNKTQNCNKQCCISTNHCEKTSDPTLAGIYNAVQKFDTLRIEQFLAIQKSAEAARMLKLLPNVETKLIRMVIFIIYID